MTDKQKRFCEEYLIDLNATQAAIRAGYSPKTANEQGSRLLANVSIRTHIDKAIAARSARTGVNADRVVRELARLAFVNPTEIVDPDTARVRETATDDDKAAISAVKVKMSSGENSDSIEREVCFADKLKALELLGRHLNMFSDNLNITGDMGVSIVNDIPKQDDS